ncbi:AAA family ATPase, partial [Brevibacillus brevis]
MQVISGKVVKAKKVVLYGPEGIGKSSLAAMFPKPIFIDTEGSTTELDVE